MGLPYNYKYKKIKNGRLCYETTEAFSVWTGYKLTDMKAHNGTYFSVYADPDGYAVIGIKVGYQWDGVSMYPDYKDLITPSAVHDALCWIGLHYDLDNTYFKRCHKVMYNMIMKKARWYKNSRSYRRWWWQRRKKYIWLKLQAKLIYFGLCKLNKWYRLT